MATFVDHVGLNTLVSSSFDDTNTITSNVNLAIATIPPEETLVGINLHRNGPYGYSTWKQLRVSENPLTRFHIKDCKMTFVTQPGPVRNISIDGEKRVRDRYSPLHSYTEPAVTQKAYPLVWNVGRHFKDEDGNVDFENPHRFSIISSYGNQQIAFANDRVSKLLKFDPDEEQTEYVPIKEMYLENGLNKQDSPLTHWEFLQYRETVFPKAVRQYVEQTRSRPQFESFFRHKREDRTKLTGPVIVSTLSDQNDDYAPENYPYGALFDRVANPNYNWDPVSQSAWPLDEHQRFLTRVYDTTDNAIYFRTQVSEHTDTPAESARMRAGEGALMSTLNPYWHLLFGYMGASQLSDTDADDATDAAYQIDIYGLAPSPLYMRRVSLTSSTAVSNPTGMFIDNTGSIELYTGGALWEAGAKRQVRNDDGTYTSAPKQPFYDTYENYVKNIKRYGKNYSIIPEFRMSAQVQDYKRTDSGIELDMFEVTGGISGSTDSSKSNFYEVYSNTDFMKNFEVIADDHKDFTNGKVLSLRCKAIKKFLPYEGFYPCQRTADIAKQFYDSFKDNISVRNQESVELKGFNYGRQLLLAPLFAPGVLFNTIKSGVAVDYPIFSTTGTVSNMLADGTQFVSHHGLHPRFTRSAFDKRIPFEALVEPAKYLADFKITAHEPGVKANLSASAEWDGQGDELYSMMANNFLAESINFFLPNGQLSSVVSKKQKDVVLQSGEVYGMRIKMRRSMNGPRGAVYHYNSSSTPYRPPQDISFTTGSNHLRETFTMYSRPSAFGPPTRGYIDNTTANTNLKNTDAFFHDFELAENRRHTVLNEHQAGSVYGYFQNMDSEYGFNFPFTPPYYHGEGWCHIYFTASSNSMTIKEIQSACTYEYTRYDNSYYLLTSSIGGGGIVGFKFPSKYESGYQELASIGPQGPGNINNNAVQLSASLNINGVGTINKRGSGGSAGSLVVDSGLEEDNRWIIQTKFETPMLNFNHITGDDHLTLPLYGSGTVPRGMWHQYGRLPEDDEGVFVQVAAIPDNYQEAVMGRTASMADMSETLGFSGMGTKLGRLADRKEIFEAVVAVPFIEKEGRKKFFALDKEKIDTYKAGPNADGALAAAAFEALTSGSPQEQIGRSVLSQIEKMKKYIFPPSFDFVNYETSKVKPVAMYIFEFSHTLTQTDLQDIWQNLPPDIGSTMEVAEVAITHPLLKKELLGPGGDSGTNTIEMPDKLKWMVFKVKQRAANNYFKKTVLRNAEVNTDSDSGNVTQDEFGSTSTIQYNWPYDFFSLVEMVKLDAEVELGNADFSDYVDHIPSWDAVQADRDKIEHIVGGLEDDPIPEIDVPEPSYPEAIGGYRAQITLTREPEGVLDSNPNVPPEANMLYIQAKTRFTIAVTAIAAGQDYDSAELGAWEDVDKNSSLARFQQGVIDDMRTRIIWDFDGDEIAAAETQHLFLSVVHGPFRAWSENWWFAGKYDSMATNAAADVAAANQQVSDSAWREEIRRYFRALYEEYDTAFKTKRKAKQKAWDQTYITHHTNVLWTAEFEIELYNSIDTGGSASVTLD